jgi:hypothetical protein
MREISLHIMSLCKSQGHALKLTTETKLSLMALRHITLSSVLKTWKKFKKNNQFMNGKMFRLKDRPCTTHNINLIKSR